MADEFDIRAHLVIDDRPANRGLDRVDARIRQTEGVAKGAGSTISRSLGAAFAAVAGLGIGRGLISAARGVIGLQGEIQQAQGGIATLLGVITKMPIGEAMKAAQNEVNELSKLAAGGVGSLVDYRNAFQAILAPGLGAGANTAELRELTKNAISAANALKGEEGVRFAGTDVSRALRQGLSETETPISIAAARAVGVSADKFRTMRPEERLATLTKGFGEFSEGAAIMGKTWAAQSATLSDGIKALIRDVTKPLFDRWSEQLGQANKWLADNQEELGQIVTRWAPRLVELWDTLIDRAGTYAAIVAGASIAQALPALPGTPGGRGARGAGGLLSRATGLGSAAAGGATSGAGGGIMAALRGLFAGFSRVAGPIAIVTTLAVAVAGAFEEFPTIFAGLMDAGGDLLAALGNIGNSFGFLTGQGSALNLVGAGVVLLFTGLVKVLTLVANGVALVVDSLGILVSLMGDVFRFATTGLKGVVQFLTGDKAGAFETTRGLEAELAKSSATRKAAVDDINRILFGAGKDGAAAGEEGGGAVSGAPGAISAAGTVVNIAKVDVQVKAEVNEDPARVAGAFDEVLDGLKRFTTQPRRLPTGPNLG